jgi:hypothetical protein
MGTIPRRERAVLTFKEGRMLVDFAAAAVKSETLWFFDPGPTASHLCRDIGFSNRPAGSSTFRLPTTPVSMSLTGSRFSSDSAPRPL